MKPQSAKAKGRNLQKWTRDLILKIFESLSANDVRSTSMGAAGIDIQLSEAALKMVPLSIECKSRDAIAVYAWMEQASENCLEKTEPVVIMKGNHAPPLALCDVGWLFNLLKELNDYKTKCDRGDHPGEGGSSKAGTDSGAA